MVDAAHSEACPNCGKVPFDSPYCPECGQRKLLEKDFNMFSIVRDAFADISSLDNRVLRTLKLLFINPGTYIASYISGARQKYVSPVKLFLIANAYYFIVPGYDTFKTTLYTQFNGLPYSNLIRPGMGEIIRESGMETAVYQSEYDAMTQILSKALLIFFPIMISCFSRLLNIRQKDHPPFINHLNHGLVLISVYLVFILSVIPFIWDLLYGLTGLPAMAYFNNELVSSLVMTFILGIYAYFLYSNILKGGWFTYTGKIVLMMLILIPLLQIYRLILLIVTVGWMEVF